MSSETFKILTQRHKGESHRETAVTIDWEGVSERDLRILARRAIIYNLQVHIQKYLEGPFPQEYKISAREAAADHTPAMTCIFAPKVPRVLAKDKLDDLLAQLSVDELKQLEALL